MHVSISFQTLQPFPYCLSCQSVSGKILALSFDSNLYRGPEIHPTNKPSCSTSTHTFLDVCWLSPLLLSERRPLYTKQKGAFLSLKTEALERNPAKQALPQFDSWLISPPPEYIFLCLYFKTLRFNGFWRLYFFMEVFMSYMT